MSPNDYRAYFYRGVAEVNLTDYQAAVGDLDKSIQIQPNAEAFYYRGIANKQLKKKSDACTDFRQSASMGFAEAQNELQQGCK